MANTYNMKGTSFPSFTIGKKGVTIYQGSVAPANSVGVDGDMFFQSGAESTIWQKAAGAWSRLGSYNTRIFNEDTSVATDEVIDSVTVNVNAKRIIDVKDTADSVGGEKLGISNGISSVVLSTADTSGNNPVDLVVDLQGDASFKVQSDTPSLITNDDGTDITIKPSDKTTGFGGQVLLKGGATTEAGQAGGNIMLEPGAGGTGAAPSQVLVPAGYVVSSNNSVVNKANITTKTIAEVTGTTAYSVTNTDHVVNVNRSIAGAASIVLPNTGIPVGRTIIVKDAKGDAATNAITVTVNGGGLIDATASNVINSNFSSMEYIWNGTKWLTTGGGGAAGAGTPGAPGADGEDGADGASAYEIAVANGFSGSQTEWLASLKGADGAPGEKGADGTNGTNGTDGEDGTNGQSAYELAVVHGFVGTEEEWLDSIVRGASAYDVAVEQGFVGTEADWIASLKGATGDDGVDGQDGQDGINGKSAYELAVDQGFQGTEEDWVASFVQGASAYEVAVDNGFVGDEAAWLASLVGPQGTQGEQGQIGPKGDDGITVPAFDLYLRNDAGLVTGFYPFTIYTPVNLTIRKIVLIGDADGTSQVNILSNSTVIGSFQVTPTRTIHEVNSSIVEGDELVLQIVSTTNKYIGACLVKGTA